MDQWWTDSTLDVFVNNKPWCQSGCDPCPEAVIAILAALTPHVRTALAPAVDAAAMKAELEKCRHELGLEADYPLTEVGMEIHSRLNAAECAAGEATRLEQENARLRKVLAAVPAETASAAWGHINAAGQLVVSEDYVRGHEATVAHVTAYVEHALRDALKETKNA